jgi:hypothetical protein
MKGAGGRSTGGYFLDKGLGAMKRRPRRRKCEFCGEAFVAMTVGQRFCGERCRERARLRRRRET